MGIRIIEGQEAKGLDRKIKWEMLSPYLKQYGNGNVSYSTLQDKMNYFVKEGVGYLAYKDLINRRFVLGEPIVAVEGYTEFTRDFQEFCTHHRKYPIYCQIGKDFAKICQDLGLWVNCLGIENKIFLPDFKVTWNNERKDLKRWLSTVSKKGVMVEEPETLDYTVLKHLGCLQN